jgi:competence protein ComEC
MVLNTLAFLAGVVALQFCAELPASHWYPVAALAAAPAAYLPRLRLPALWLLGFFWAALHAQQHHDDLLSEGLQGRTLLLQGRVNSIPVRLAENDWRFVFEAERIDAGNGWQPFDRRVRLGWYRASEQPRAGERWQLAVRLKRPHGYANPGGFDYERWLFQQRIAATGYVREDRRNRRIQEGVGLGATAMRRGLSERLEALPLESPSLALVRALTIGERSHVSTAQWDVLRSTGTSHLMAISGLHISLVAGLAFLLSRLSWSHLGALPEILPARRAAALLSLLAALLYAALAGFSVPTQRALIMVSVAMLALVSSRQTQPRAVLCLAVWGVLAVDPLAVLSAGWWLSFWAVSLILYAGGGRLGRQSIWRTWGHIHLVLAVSLMPVLLVSFQQASLVAPLANLVAVPWVSLLVIPLSLLGVLLLSLSDAAGGWLIGLACMLLDLLWPLLAWLANTGVSTWHQPQPPAWTLLPAVAGVLLLFAPSGVPGRWAGLWLLLPMLLLRPSSPAAGEAEVTMLDVGQGLSVVVRTRHHTLVYDTGPRHSPTFDTGSRVVVPWLRSRAIRRIDHLIISHGDNDHIGGLRSVMEELPVGRLSAGESSAVSGYPAESCREHERWTWDGVTFSLLHPPAATALEGNNASCVLRIESAGGRAVLLTGDIESVVENRLVAEHAEALRTEVLVVPHHGSLTSSTMDFIEAVGAGTVLHPAGYRNRYGFPRPEVVERYRLTGARQYDSARHGALRVKLPADDRPVEVSAWRCRLARYWRPAACL